MKTKTYVIVIEDKNSKEITTYGVLFHRVDAELIVNYLKNIPLIDKEIYYKEEELDFDGFILP